MQFNSLQFLVFFAAVVSLYFAAPYRHRWILLLAASYCFYMAWRPAYILLIIASTLVDYLAAMWIGDAKTKARRRGGLAMSLAANFGLLFTFKYFNFFSLSLGHLLGTMGVTFQPPYLDVLLPVGISFYTFQTVSYTIEVYLGRQQPERHLGRFALYVAFFPQLVAGPIERPGNLLPQLAQPFDFNYQRVRDGLIMMLWGMFKKVVVADRLAMVVNHVYGTPERYPGPVLVVATVFFAFQIYADFSGYSDIAIGAAQVLGIRLMRNFNRPYISRSVTEFWRRWHISLSTWFRDYVYIPLGGNRVSTARLYLNLMIVFTVSGLWHGANWTFVAWGALHGAYCVLGRLTSAPRGALAQYCGLTRLPRLHAALQTSITFVLVCAAWVFFRADTLHDAIYVLAHAPAGWTHLAAYGGVTRILASMDLSVKAFAASAVAIGCVLLVEWLHQEGSVVDLLSPRRWWIRWAVYIGAGWAIMNLGAPEQLPFVYFQF